MVRLAVERDAEIMHDIVRHTFGGKTSNLAYFKNKIKNEEAYVMVDVDLIVGVAVVIPHKPSGAFLDIFAIVKSHQNKGFGKSLLKFIVARCKEVWLTVLVSNRKAVDFYVVNGFTKVRRVTKSTGETAWLMQTGKGFDFLKRTR